MAINLKQLMRIIATVSKDADIPIVPSNKAVRDYLARTPQTITPFPRARDNVMTLDKIPLRDKAPTLLGKIPVTGKIDFTRFKKSALKKQAIVRTNKYFE